MSGYSRLIVSEVLAVVCHTRGRHIFDILLKLHYKYITINSKKRKSGP